MNAPAMPQITHSSPAFALRAFMALCLAITLGACGNGASAPLGDPPLKGADIGGAFTLVDKAGKPVHWSDFNGRYRMVYFGYTYCPDICPTETQRMMQGYRLFAKNHEKLARNIAPMFISVDPERDTPQVVGEFAEAFSDRLIGLTGTKEQVKKAADAFRVFYSRGETTAGGGYLVNHSSIVYLFGPKGEPIATLPADKGAKEVAAVLEKWVR